MFIKYFSPHFIIYSLDLIFFLRDSTTIKIKNEKIKEIIYILKNLASLTPKSKSERKNRIIASKKKEKYIIAIKPNIKETQKGQKSIEINNNREKKIRSIIPLFYTLKFKIQIFFKIFFSK
ncbi:TPA: hypothetical protein DD445_00510 [Candidatus Nomurabacteria bacterium]|nr:hypothetical protein [Candidatus Nomurabacteria bacterium]HBP27266.1 hypothetical protein [Candidatus Nomurabacteria bacterium]HBR66439.1 hypothetical protein [Candidatus Nomurabacteria bacterium]HCU47104.1 hypothetical protein [Candidatus Nomurabacteria bacterium]